MPQLIARWEPKLGVTVSGYFLQRMKTKWGSCNHQGGNIRLNTELVKKPKDLLEYVVVHEMLHLIEPTHSERFLALLNAALPVMARGPSGAERAASGRNRVEGVERRTRRRRALAVASGESGT